MPNSSPNRPTVSRSVALRGPKFYWDEVDGKRRMMFVNHFDSCTRIGPRLATRQDSEDHVQAWAVFVAETNGVPEPMRPRITFEDPEDGPPAPGSPSETQRRRQAAYDRGERA